MWWTFEPLTVDMRHPGIIKGMADALLGCREGDAVEVYMTYNMAYGDDYFGIIPKESPIAWSFLRWMQWIGQNWTPCGIRQIKC